MNLFVKSFLWALLACGISLGTILTPWYSLSARVAAPEISRVQECLLDKKDWSCSGPHQWIPINDPGAISWQEVPVHIWLNQYKFETKPNWNPYIGSGYPLFLDGIYRNSSLIRQWLNFFPSDQGRDVVIFFRFLIWTWGIVFAVSLVGASGLYLFFVAVASTMLTYMLKYLDLVFLDVEMAVPWIFSLFLLLKDHKNSKMIYLPFVILGLWVGTQSFIQAEIVFVMIVALFGMCCFFVVGRQALWASLIFFAAFCAVGLSHLLEFKSYFGELISNRTFVSCVGTATLPWGEILRNSYLGLVKHAEMHTYFTVLALPLIAFEAYRNRWIRIAFLFFLFLLYWISFGAPAAICHFEGFKSIHYERHLSPYLQSLFLILVTVSLWNLAKGYKYRKIILTLGFCLTVIPLLNRIMISVEHFKGELPREKSFYYESIPLTNVYSKVQELSLNEDRRHFSPDQRLFPNYSTAFSIMDLRVLYGSFPKRMFTLNDELFQRWHETPFYKHADRFVGPEESIDRVPEDFEKLLLLHRVSLVTYSKYSHWLEGGKIYNEKNCKLIQQDPLASLYFCSQIQGVGFFPHETQQAENQQEALEILKKLPLDQVLDFAVVEDKTHAPIAAEGKVTGLKRGKDQVTYDLAVEKEGYFIFTDAYFPGWKAKVNGTATPLFPANLAFKAVWLPKGNIRLEWLFEKAE